MTAREQYAEVLAVHWSMDFNNCRCRCGSSVITEAGHRTHVADALAAALPAPEQAVREALARVEALADEIEAVGNAVDNDVVGRSWVVDGIRREISGKGSVYRADPDAQAKAWDQGYKTGYSHRGPYGDGQPVPANPYRSDDLRAALDGTP